MIELLVAMAVLSVLLLLMMGALSSVSSFYVNNQDRTRTEEKGRAIIELMSREVTPAVVDTRMQFVVLPGEEISNAGAAHVVGTSQAAIWLAPLGDGGDIRCVGYFLTSDTDQKKYRLKRIYIKSDNPDDYYPNLGSATDVENRTSPVDADWLTDTWDETAFDDVSAGNDQSVVSTVSDGVVALWIRAVDAMGNPVPHLSSSTAHPPSNLLFNSASYFYMADGEPFDDGSTFVYLKKNRLTMKANRLPTALEIAIVMISEDEILRGGAIPPQENVLEAKLGILDLDASLEKYSEDLKTAGYYSVRVFRTAVKLTNGG